MRVLEVPVSLSLGSQVVGTQSTPTAITLSSVGGSAVTIASIVSSDPKQFPIVGSTWQRHHCRGRELPGQPCLFPVDRGRSERRHYGLEQRRRQSTEHYDRRYWNFHRCPARQLPRPVVEVSGRLRIGMGHQLRAPG